MYAQALCSGQAIFPLSTSGDWTFAWQKQQPGPAAIPELLNSPFCTQSSGKTYKLLDLKKLNSSMRESGKGLFCPFLSICLP